MIDSDSGSHHMSPYFDGFDEDEPTYRKCCICDKEHEETEMVRDFINENDLCNRPECIRQKMENESEYLEGTELTKMEQYYNNLLNQIK